MDPQITLNPVVANAVTSRRVPSGSDSFKYPAHIDLEFGTGYVDVFRLSDLRSDFDTQIASLQSLLKDRVDLRTRYPYYLAGTVGNFRSDPELEAIPRYGARPAFYARPHYVDATLFSGVAYLTQFVRTNAFVNVDQATYVTQGITRDGKYLIDARFATSSSMPTRLPTQPPDWRVPDPAFDLFWINFVREIDFRSDSAFAPSLAHVDAMLQTLRLSAP